MSHPLFVVPSPREDMLLVQCGECGEATYIDMDDLPYLPESRFITGLDAELLLWLGDQHRAPEEQPNPDEETT